MNILQKGVGLSILLFSMLDPISMVFAQNKMYANEKSGSFSNYELNTISKIHFSSGNLIVSKVNGSQDTYSIQDLKNLTFNEIATSAFITENIITPSAIVFPNPANNLFYIQLNSIDAGFITVSLFDIQGKIIQNKTFSKGIGVNELTMNIESLPKGLYFCRIQCGKNIENIKIIKN